jgi:ceramide glucosyltransferase
MSGWRDAWFWWWFLNALVCGAAGYAVVAAVCRHPRRQPPNGGRWEAVTVLKPLCGDEAGLYDNLVTFCTQDYPRYQVLFGVRSPDDPAVQVVERVRREHPGCDTALIVDSRVHGGNLKVSNMINLIPHARYAWVVAADSDVAVRPDYLRSVTEPLADPGTGVVTCLYRGHPTGGLWSRVGVSFIDQWFAPSVRIAYAAARRAYGLGPTLAFRRADLDAIGGYQGLSDCLADDYWLAERIRRRGLRTVLSHVVIANTVGPQPGVRNTGAEAGIGRLRFGELWARETRWLRTVCSLRPVGYAFLPITFTSPWLLLGVWLDFCGAIPPPARGVLDAARWIVGLGLAARVLLPAKTAATWRDFVSGLVTVPLRDVLLWAEWAAAFGRADVVWRSARVPVGAGTPDPGGGNRQYTSSGSRTPEDTGERLL